MSSVCILNISLVRLHLRIVRFRWESADISGTQIHFIWFF